MPACSESTHPQLGMNFSGFKLAGGRDMTQSLPRHYGYPAGNMMSWPCNNMASLQSLQRGSYGTSHLTSYGHREGRVHQPVGMNISRMQLDAGFVLENDVFMVNGFSTGSGRTSALGMGDSNRRV